MTRDLRVLTVNTGSSSVKLALYAAGAGERLVLSGRAERIGLAGGGLAIRDGDGSNVLELDGVDDHAVALDAFLKEVERRGGLDAVGHRVVHGGAELGAPVRVTDQVLDALRALVQLAPDHMPQAIACIEEIGRMRPSLPQVACFDTAFHRTLPPVARLVPLPRDLDVRRYGFHGLSYEYVVAELRSVDPVAAAGRLLVAHLGNGASMAAILDGSCLETTMGFTPAGGLVMGMRPGDLDPGLIVHLMRTHGFDAGALDEIVNRNAGLLGVSGISSDMKDLLESDDPRAAEAVELFCYQARKFVGALATVLGGLDTLVFTGGIGERGASVRWRICDSLEHLGVELDRQANDAHAPVISAKGSAVTVRVVATDEDLMIARHTRDLVSRAS